MVLWVLPYFCWPGQGASRFRLEPTCQGEHGARKEVLPVKIAFIKEDAGNNQASVARTGVATGRCVCAGGAASCQGLQCPSKRIGTAVSLRSLRSWRSLRSLRSSLILRSLPCQIRFFGLRCSLRSGKEASARHNRRNLSFTFLRSCTTSLTERNHTATALITVPESQASGGLGPHNCATFA